MITIAVTGGMGAGKTETTKMLEARGAVVIHADQVAHQTYQPNGPAYDAVVERFGSQVLAGDGSVDRAKLGKIVFNDSEARKRLEAIVWHHTRVAISGLLTRHRADGKRVAVIEAAVLYEAAWDDLADYVVTVEASEDERVRRLLSRTSLAESEIRDRIASQLPSAERIARADYHISNDGDLRQLSQAVNSIWRAITL